MGKCSIITSKIFTDSLTKHIACIEIIATSIQYMKWQFLVEVNFFLKTDDSRRLTAIGYLIDLNNIKKNMFQNGYISHPQMKSHNLSFMNS